MPIQGRFWTSEELQKLLTSPKTGLPASRQQVYNLAIRYGWDSQHPGLYTGGPTDDRSTPDAYLAARKRRECQGDGETGPLVWDDSFDTDCPECGAFAVEGEPGRRWYRCVLGHEGKL